MRVGVIGAGPAGILAAIKAAELGASVNLFDTNLRLGKKLLLTGSGRCNLTNRHSVPHRFACDDPQFLQSAWNQFNQADLVDYFSQIGIAVYATEDGWYYPVSDSARNVVEILEQLVSAAEIKFWPESKVEKVIPSGYGFKLFRENEPKPIYVDSLIIATGGKAYPQTGSDGNLLGVIRGLGHTVLPVRPALAPLLIQLGVFDDLRGVRLDAGCTLFKEDQAIESTTGNIIFTEWGINGPGVMDLSYLINDAEKNKYQLEVNFLPALEELLVNLFENAQKRGLSARAPFLALLPEKVVNWGFKRALLDLDCAARVLSSDQFMELLKQFTRPRARITGVKGFKFAQCSWGGVAASEVNGASMQSKVVPGLFFCGEVLNVVGSCGGYNLQWAFASGWIAGRGAALREGQD